MKHVFVINPVAGKNNNVKKLSEKIKAILNEEEYEIYVTKAPLDGKNFVNEYCHLHQGEEIRFYSCGGDGTLNEVINGAYGFNNVSIACYPSGSGNDFIKYFGKKEDFLNFEKLINGKTTDVDLIRFNNRFVLNIFNLGFDANAAEMMIKLKKVPLVKGFGAYILGVIISFLKKMTTDIVVKVDDKIIYDGEGLLCAVANAICYGGGFYCAPRAQVDDGLLDVVVVKKMSRLRFVKMIKYYKRGTHLDEPRLKNDILYTRGEKVTITSSKNVNYAIDGEMGKANSVELEIVPKAIKFVTL